MEQIKKRMKLRGIRETGVVAALEESSHAKGHTMIVSSNVAMIVGRVTRNGSTTTLESDWKSPLHKQAKSIASNAANRKETAVWMERYEQS